MRRSPAGGAVAKSVELVACSAFVLGLLCVVFYDVRYFPPMRFFGHLDSWRSVGPQLFELDYHLQHDRAIPLWDFLVFCGRPFVADISGMALYPPNLIRSLLNFEPTPFSTHTGLAVLAALHYLLGGIGVYLLMRAIGGSRSAGLVSLLVFLFNVDHIARSSQHFFHSFAYPWLPWIVLALHTTLSAQDLKRKLFYALWTGAAVGMLLLAGSGNEFNLYIGVCVAGFFVLWHVVRIDGLWKKPAEYLRMMGVNTAAAGMAAVLGVIMGLASILPAMELRELSTRVALEDTFEPIEIHEVHTVPQLITTFANWPGPKGIGIIHGAGTSAFFLALCGLLSAKRREAILFGILFYATLDLSIGSPMPVSRVIVSMSPYPLASTERAGLVVLLPMAMLSGLGLDSLFEHVRRSDTLRLARVAAAFVLGGVVLWFFLAGVAATDYFDFPRTVIAAPVLFVAAAAVGQFVRAPFAFRAMGVALMTVEALAWSHYYNNWRFNMELIPNNSQDVRVVRTLAPPNHRGIDDLPNRDQYFLRPMINGYDPACLYDTYRVVAAEGSEDLYRRVIFKEGGMTNLRTNLFLKRFAWLAKQYVEGPLPDRNELFPAATTVFLRHVGERPPIPKVEIADLPKRSVSPESAREWRTENVAALCTPVFAQATGTPEAPGMFYLFSTIPWPGKHCALMMRLKASGPVECRFSVADATVPEKREYTYLKSLDVHGSSDGELFELPLPDYKELQIGMSTVSESGIPPDVQVTDMYFVVDEADEGALILDLKFTGRTCSMQIGELPGPRILTFVDSYYPGWAAFVDGKRVPILKANDAFKAVVLEKGRHEVEFVFNDRGYVIGVIASWVAALAVAAGLYWSRPRAVPV